MKRLRKPTLGHVRLAPPDDEAPPYGDGLGDDAPTEARGPVCGPPKATVQLCMKRTGRPGKVMMGPMDACHLMRGLEDAPQEHFSVLHLDTRHRVIGIENVAKGTLAGVEVHPRDVFKAAILGNAAAILMVHNHPSGDGRESRADTELTERLRRAGELVGIAVLDHIIVAKEGCVSLASKGLMGPVMNGAKYRRSKD